MREYVSLEEARDMLLHNCQRAACECLDLTAALGRVLREDVLAGENIPPFDRSSLDGYAFDSRATLMASREQPAVLKVIEAVAAGSVATQRITKNTAIRIMTGAPIPEGADAVEKYENIELSGAEIRITSRFRPMDNIIKAGEDVRVGDTVAAQGMVLEPPLLGLLAALGVTRVRVYAKPAVALISTGDELSDEPGALQPGKIRNSTRITLQGFCTRLGADPVIIGTARDEVTQIMTLLEAGLERADVVITTGGISAGDYDLVVEAVRRIGAELLFWKINIKPGMPTLAARKNGKVILGLSGNPASGLVVFQLLAIPFIRKMAGHRTYHLAQLEAVLLDGFKKPSPARRFLRGQLVLENGQTGVRLTGRQGNAVLSSMVGCDVLLEVPSGSGPLPAGARLTAFRVD